MTRSSRPPRRRIHFEFSTMSEYFYRQHYRRRGADQVIARVAREGLR